VQDGGKYVRRFSAKPSGGLCAVLPYLKRFYRQTEEAYCALFLTEWEVSFFFHASAIDLPVYICKKADPVRLLYETNMTGFEIG